MKNFNGNVLFLDRSDINTDEIIPARYLTEISKAALKPHLFEDLELKGFNPDSDINDRSVVIARDNFGCGSSREHAPWALEANGINLLIAPGFARIFRQNMFNCGLLAMEIPAAECDTLFDRFSSVPTECTVNLEERSVTFRSGSTVHTLQFNLSAFEEDLVRAEGWVQYADSRY